MPGRTIAIGDIHGCSAALRALLTAIDPQADDTLVPLGDYIDRGPDSKGTIDELMALDQRCRLVPLLGNHELMLLDVIDGEGFLPPWLSCGGAATLRSYGGNLEDIPDAHLDFIRGCRKYYETATHFFVHANYEYDIPLAEQPDYLLFWEHLHFRMPRRHQSGKTAVVGHTSQKSGEVFDAGHVVCIDTFCHGGGWLTALDVASGRIWQADRAGTLRPGDPTRSP
jgi:serine/threonine protein phosphatase 1